MKLIPIKPIKGDAAADPITVNLECVPLWDAAPKNPILEALERIIATSEAIDREIKAIKYTIENK